MLAPCSYILALKEIVASVPYLTEFTLLLLRVSAFQMFFRKTFSIMTGFKPLFVLRILLARTTDKIFDKNSSFQVK